MTALTQEVLLKARVAVDQVRLSRLATQNAIERSRESLAATRAALVSLRDAHHRCVRKFRGGSTRWACVRSARPFASPCLKPYRPSPSSSEPSQSGNILVRQEPAFARLKGPPIIAANASSQPLAVGIDLGEGQTTSFALSNGLVLCAHISDLTQKGRPPKPTPPSDF